YSAAIGQALHERNKVCEGKRCACARGELIANASKACCRHQGIDRSNHRAGVYQGAVDFEVRSQQGERHLSDRRQIEIPHCELSKVLHVHRALPFKEVSRKVRPPVSGLSNRRQTVPESAGSLLTCPLRPYGTINGYGTHRE